MTTFHIETDRQTYHTGDTITGKVWVLIPATISNTEGITLKFQGVESVKWNQHIQAKAENFRNESENQLSSSKVVSMDHKQVTHVHVKFFLKQQPNEISVSQYHSSENKKENLKTKIIKTAENKYYQVNFLEKKNEISKGCVKLMPSGKLQAGKYSFPFEFVTSPDWPASFKQESKQKKVNITYYLTVTLEPYSPRYQFKEKKTIILWDKSLVKKVNHFKSKMITSFCCFKKGYTQIKVSLNKEGYQIGQNGQVLIQIDNSQCLVDIQGLTIKLFHTSKIKVCERRLEKDEVFIKQLSCIAKAGKKIEGQNSLRVPFKLTKSPSTTQSKIISSDYTLEVELKYDVFFHQKEKFSIPFIVYEQNIKNQVPWEMRSKWEPKIMSKVKIELSNQEFKQKYQMKR